MSSPNMVGSRVARAGGVDNPPPSSYAAVVGRDERQNHGGANQVAVSAFGNGAPSAPPAQPYFTGQATHIPTEQVRAHIDRRQDANGRRDEVHSDRQSHQGTPYSQPGIVAGSRPSFVVNPAAVGSGRQHHVADDRQHHGRTNEITIGAFSNGAPSAPPAEQPYFTGSHIPTEQVRHQIDQAQAASGSRGAAPSGRQSHSVVPLSQPGTFAGSRSPSCVNPASEMGYCRINDMVCPTYPFNPTNRIIHTSSAPSGPVDRAITLLFAAIFGTGVLGIVTAAIFDIPLLTGMFFSACAVSAFAFSIFDKISLNS